MLGTQLLNGTRRKMPQMARNIISSPMCTILLRVIRRTVRHCNNQYTLFRQEFIQCIPRLIQMFQMLHNVPQSNDIKAAGSKILQCGIRLYIQIEVFLSKYACLRIPFHCLHLPASLLHSIGKISCSRTDIQQTSFLTMCFANHQACLTAQHIATHPVVHPVHKAFFRIGMGNVIGSFIISAYLGFHRKILRKEKATILTTTQIECFAGSIMIYASHSTLYMCTTTYRTDFYGEFIH